MKKLIGMSILLVLGLTGCQNSAEMSASDPDQLLQNEVIHESLANTEYDSIEGFLADSDEGAFVLDSQRRTEARRLQTRLALVRLIPAFLLR